VEAPNIEHTVDMGGQVGQTDSSDFSGLGQGGAVCAYTCTPTTPAIWPPGAVEANLSPLDFTKPSSP
jgi:hypothetical protein